MAAYDFVVVGAGPGGYVSAIRAAQLGMKTAVVERDALGGICLNWGCIPSKALLRNAEVLTLFHRAEEFGITYKDLTVDFGAAIGRSRGVVGKLTRGVGGLLRKNRVDHIAGQGVLTSGTSLEIKGTGQSVEAGHIVLATGARARTLPNLPIDGSLVMTSREALEIRELPKSALIVGGGATGCEFAYLYASYGVDVTIVELLPHLLPNEDEEVSQHLERAFSKQGITTLTGTKVTGMEARNGQAQVTMEGPDGAQSVECDRILVAVGVQGNVEEMGLDEVGVATERSFITVDDRMRTSVPTVSAIGDVTGPPLLAHAAMAQGILTAEAIAGHDTRPLVRDDIPRAVYCHPQVASVGLTEAQAAEQGHITKVGRFPYRANGKALALGDYAGLIKIVSDEETGALLGAQMIGPETSELLGELSVARMLEATPLEIGRAVHPHPTLSETLMEASLAAFGEAIHM